MLPVGTTPMVRGRTKQCSQAMVNRSAARAAFNSGEQTLVVEAAVAISSSRLWGNAHPRNVKQVSALSAARMEEFGQVVEYGMLRSSAKAAVEARAG